MVALAAARGVFTGQPFGNGAPDAPARPERDPLGKLAALDRPMRGFTPGLKRGH